MATAIAVVSAVVASRTANVPRVLAQAPASKPGGAKLQARPSVPAGAAQTSAAPKSTAGTLQIMAVVNQEQITRAELGRECIRRYGEEVLESLVNRQLIAEACAQKGIQITDADVTAEIDRIANRFGLSRDRWLTLLRDERGFSEEQYRREVVWPILALRHAATTQVEVTQDELKKAFESEFGKRVKARLIAVDSRQKAEQIHSQAVANPAQFGELSKQHSVDAAVASAYGVIPPIRRHLGDANVEQVAFSLKPGQISGIVNVANMHYILKCEEILPEQFLSGQQLADQQARLKEKLKENKMRAAAGEFFENVQKQAKIVNVLNDPQKQQQMPGVAATVNGRPITLQELAEECIARHGADVLDGEINRKILQQELNRKRLVVGEQDLDAEVARAADSYGYVKPDGKPDVEKWLNSVTEQPGATVDLYVRDAVWPSVALKKLVGTKVDITEDDLKKGFESNYGERVEVQAIVIGDHRQAQKVWDMARSNNTESFFAELAQQYSIEPSSRSNGGKVPPIRRYSGSPVLEEAAFKLKAGDLSGIIAIDKQFIVLRCLGRTRPVQMDFAAVKDNLYKDMEEKKLRAAMTKEFDRLREVAQVDNFLAASSHSGSRPSGATTIAAGPESARGGTGSLRTSPAAAAAGRTPSANAPSPRGVAPATATAPRAGGPQSR
jgi:parvulin-like peptidyl-prolyl isomerase